MSDGKLLTPLRRQAGILEEGLNLVEFYPETKETSKEDGADDTLGMSSEFGACLDTGSSRVTLSPPSFLPQREKHGCDCDAAPDDPMALAQSGIVTKPS